MFPVLQFPAKVLAAPEHIIDGVAETEVGESGVSTIEYKIPVL
jgi:hypothetical protein